MRSHRIPVLDHGLVELVDSMGDDLAIVNAAQASFDTESTEYGPKEAGILRFLMREEHGVPFESAVFKFKIRMPIFLARQYVKHRVASWSEQSGRYDELQPMFYVPQWDQVRSQVGKPGAYTFEPVDDSTASRYVTGLKYSNRIAWDAYQAALKDGVAKEIARLSLPVNLYTSLVWTLNARSLFNVIRLRADAHAQREAQAYAQVFEDLASLVIPDAMHAFIAQSRPKP